MGVFLGAGYRSHRRLSRAERRGRCPCSRRRIHRRRETTATRARLLRVICIRVGAASTQSPSEWRRWRERELTQGALSADAPGRGLTSVSPGGGSGGETGLPSASTRSTGQGA